MIDSFVRAIHINGGFDIKPQKFSISPDFGESVTDKASYCPTLNDVRTLSPNSSSGSGEYDFPNGVDNGLRLTQLRDPRADIADKEATYKVLKATVDEQFKNASIEIQEVAKSRKSKKSTSEVISSTVQNE